MNYIGFLQKPGFQPLNPRISEIGSLASMSPEADNHSIASDVSFRGLNTIENHPLGVGKGSFRSVGHISDQKVPQ